MKYIHHIQMKKSLSLLCKEYIQKITNSIQKKIAYQQNKSLSPYSKIFGFFHHLSKAGTITEPIDARLRIHLSRLSATNDSSVNQTHRFPIFFKNVKLLLLCIIGVIQMHAQADSIRIEKIIQSDWAAYIHIPEKNEKYPAIITLGGAEGGLSFSEVEANDMVEEGFVVMRLGYFKYTASTRKQKLSEIRIEKVQEAIQWLKQQPSVDSSKISLLGISKGAELALCVASLTPDIKAVVAHVPSHVVWYGLGKMKGLHRSSWSYKGQPLPFVPYAKPKSGWFTKRIAEFYEAGLEAHTEKIAPAAIPVENMKCPVLLTSGGLDDIWPSALMAKEIEKRLHENNFQYDVKRINFPDAGHGLFGKLPDQNDQEAMQKLASGGGTPLANYNARQETWKVTFEFLRRNLNG
jgi:uncharacterized protein